MVPWPENRLDLNNGLAINGFVRQDTWEKCHFEIRDVDNFLHLLNYDVSF